MCGIILHKLILCTSGKPYFLYAIFYEGSCLSLICLHLPELAYMEHELSACYVFQIFY